MSHTNPLPELPEPFVHCYEWKDLRNGTRRSFSAAPYNGMRCSNSLALYTAEQYQAGQREAYDLGARSTAAQPAGWVDDEEWEQLAWQLCAEENGEEACNELVWEGGPIPEPWGDRWLKYEGEAKRMISLVRQYAPPAAAQPVEPPIPNGWVPLRIEWEPGYPEDVAFGPQIMMDRLKKWLDKHFATVVAAASGDSTPPSASSVPYRAISQVLASEMKRAVTNGANSVSMPDELVEIAAWLDSVQGDPSGALRPEPEAVGQDRVRAWSEAPGAERVWTCKVGGPVAGIPNGGDSPMRAAVSQAFEQITGFEARFIFSGWGGELTEGERAVVENRPAMPTFEVRVAGPDDVFSYSDELFALRHANSVNQAYLADRAKHPDSEVLCVATVHAAEPPQAASGERGD